MSSSALSGGPPSGNTRGRSLVGRAVGICAVPVVLLVGWAVTSSLITSTIFVTPAEGLAAFFEQFGRGTFYGDLAYTLEAVAIGFLISAVVGFLLGFVIGLNRGVERVAGTLVYGMYSIPKVTLYPLFLLFFGLGLLSQIAFVLLHGIFPMMVITMSTVGLVGKSYAKLAAASFATTGQYLRKVLLPAVVPSVVSALRICFSACFLAQILAELLSSNAGLGGELRKDITLTDMQGIVAVVLVVAVIAVVVSQGFQLFERSVARRWGSDDQLAEGRAL